MCAGRQVSCFSVLTSYTNAVPFSFLCGVRQAASHSISTGLMLQNPGKHPLSLVFLCPVRSSYSLQHTGKRENWSSGRAILSYGWLTMLATTASTTTRIVLVTELATHISPLAQAKSGNQGAIAIWAFLTQIGKQTSALPNH